jgi:phosphatidylinositol alpha-1,6-mannosyltransferase
LRRQCRRAAGVAYIADALKAGYPTGPGAFTATYSDIELGPESFTANPRDEVRRVGDQRLVTVGSLEQLYKGTDTLIEAVAGLRRSGLPVHLVVVGDGKYRPMLEALAARLGVSDLVQFVGAVPPGAPVRRHLDDADLFVLPSRAEGLPKAVIEAMARALPCVASTVGGNPELLPPEDLIAPGDATALTDRLREVLLDESRLSAMSTRNLIRAQDYSLDRLVTRRESFYRALRDATASSAGVPADHRPGA